MLSPRTTAGFRKIRQEPAKPRPSALFLQQITPLTTRLKAQTDPNAIAPLLQFRTYEVLDAVGRYSGVITQEMAEKLPLPAIASNPHLPESLVPWVIEQGFELLIDPEKANPIHQVFIPYFLSAEVYAKIALAPFKPEKNDNHGPIVDHMISRLKGGRRRDFLSIMNVFGPQFMVLVMRGLATEGDEIFSSALQKFTRSAPQMVTELLRGWLSAKEIDKAWRERVLADHLDAVVKDVVQSRNLGAMLDLLDHTNAMRKPARLHEAILDHPDTTNDQLYIVAQHARGEAFRRAFQCMLERLDPTSFQQTLDLLAIHNPEGLGSLRADDLMPLLRSENDEMRLCAIRLLSHLQAVGENRGPEPPNSAIVGETQCKRTR